MHALTSLANDGAWPLRQLAAPPNRTHPLAQGQRTARQTDQTVGTNDAALVARHLPDLFRYARSLGAHDTTADDLCQEAFVAAWRKQKQLLPEPALATFLRRAVRYSWLDHRRSQRRHDAAVARAVERLWRQHDVAERDQRVDAAKSCLEQLRGRAAEAVRRSYQEGEGRAAVADALGMQPNGVRTLLARTRRWLAECIERITR